jgi:hypothetical protein
MGTCIGLAYQHFANKNQQKKNPKMKRNILLLVLVLAVGALAVYFLQNRSKSTIDGDWSRFNIQDTARITKVFLADLNNHRILLERMEDRSWRVNGKFDARPDVVQNLLGTIKLQQLRAPVPKSMFNNVVRKIAGTHTKVEVYLDGNPIPDKVFYVGGSSPDQSGTYMQNEGAEQPALVHIEGHYGFLGPRYSVNENVWKSTAIFSYPSERLKDIVEISLTYPSQPQESFIIRITDGQPEIFNIDGVPVKAINTERVYDYIRRFRQVHFEGWEETKSEAFRDSILNSQPLERYKVTDKTGKTNEVLTFLKPAPPGGMDYEDQPITHDLDRMYGWINNSEFVLLQYYIFDPLRVKVDYFRNSEIVDK